MPRKVKTEKPPLQFLERSLGGARVPDAPEVRAALHPRDFFTEPRATALGSWVSPQFQTSLTAAAPARRGRRRCQSATSILHSKNSVCKFPSLTFETRLPKQTPGTPRRQVTPVRRGNAARCSEGAASSSRCSIPPEVPSDPAEQGGRTPDVLEEGRQRAPPRHQPPDILVADTPERDYGLKVTWRRRKDLMTAMKASGHLSDSDVLIHSSCSELAR